MRATPPPSEGAGESPGLSLALLLRVAATTTGEEGMRAAPAAVLGVRVGETEGELRPDWGDVGRCVRQRDATGDSEQGAF